MSEKPTAAFVLSLIGGILEFLAGLAISAIGGLMTWFLGGIGAIFGVYWIVLGLIILIGAVIMYNQPSSARTWGIVILVLSIISGLNILALIGGILAIIWKASGVEPSPPPPPT